MCPATAALLSSRDPVRQCKAIAHLSQSRALRIGKAQTGRQMRAEDAVLDNQVFVLEEQSGIHQARHIRQQPHPLVVALTICPAETSAQGR